MPKKATGGPKYDWTEIETLYLAGVKPIDIAKRESAKKQKLTARLISKKAEREGWKVQKGEIKGKTADKIAESLAMDAVSRHREFLGIVNPLLTAALNQALALLSEGKPDDIRIRAILASARLTDSYRTSMFLPPAIAPPGQAEDKTLTLVESQVTPPKKD